MNHPATHKQGEFHHHHTHAASSLHKDGAHILQLEDINYTLFKHENRKPFSSGMQKSKILDNLSLSVHAGEMVALVGASGSGKTILCDLMMGHAKENADITGKIWFSGEESTLKDMKRRRGEDIAFIPQSPASLDPSKKYLYGQKSYYPHELSGGMIRRTLTDEAITKKCKLIVADEPTSGLDSTESHKTLEVKTLVFLL